MDCGSGGRQKTKTYFSATLMPLKQAGAGSRTLKCSGGTIRCTDTSGGLRPDNPAGLVAIEDWAAVKAAI